MGQIASSQLNKLRKKLLQERKELSERESAIGKDMRRKLSAVSLFPAGSIGGVAK